MCYERTQGGEATEDILRWLWDEGFAAVAGDAISWEVSSFDILLIKNPTRRGTESADSWIRR